MGVSLLVLAGCSDSDDTDPSAADDPGAAVDPADEADEADPGGSGTTSATDDPYVAALAANLAATGSPITLGQAECLAPVIVDALGGPDAFVAAGIEPDDLVDPELAGADGLGTAGVAVDPADAASVGAAAIGCGVDLAGAIGAGIGSDLSPAARSCLDDRFDAEVVGRILVLDDAAATAVDAALDCAHLLD